MKKICFIGIILVALLNCSCYSEKKNSKGKDSKETVTITKEMISVDTSNRKYYPVMSKIILDNAEHPDIKSTINTLSSMDDSYIIDFVQTAQSYGANFVIDVASIMKKVQNGTGLNIYNFFIRDVSAEEFKAIVTYSVANGNYNQAEEIRSNLPDIDFCNRSDIPGLFWHFINGFEKLIKEENDQNIVMILVPYRYYNGIKFCLIGFLYTIE